MPGRPTEAPPHMDSVTWDNGRRVPAPAYLKNNDLGPWAKVIDLQINDLGPWAKVIVFQIHGPGPWPMVIVLQIHGLGPWSKVTESMCGALLWGTWALSIYLLIRKAWPSRGPSWSDSVRRATRAQGESASPRQG